MLTELLKSQVSLFITPEQLTFLVLLLGFLALLTVLLLVVFRSPVQAYERYSSILTPAEQHFYKVLASAVGGRAIIMAKVRIADVIRVRRTVKGKQFWSYFSKISQKHIDFVLLEPSTLQTLCLIELDDKSHLQVNRSQRDKFVNRIMAEVGIPLYRFPVRRRYSGIEILERLQPVFV